ncbi:MAG: cytochrome c [Anaerolineae bacterium]|jgi:mono/diheme cytochrome c family protein
MLHKIRWFMILSLAVASVIALAACGPSAAPPTPTVAPPTPTPTEAATAPPTVAATPTTPAATPTVAAAATTPAATGAQGTSEQQVAAGQKVYTTDCESCHGADLQGVTGPALTQPIIAEYGNAKQLVDFTSQLMPQNAPGSLSQEQYYDVTAFILNKDGLLPAGETLTPKDAANIKLTK